MTLKKESIELIVFDFDGVMTDNRVIVDENGKESVIVSRADGLGVSILKQKNMKMLILSTEKNKVVARRAEKLNIPVIQGADKKEELLAEYLRNNDIPREKVMYVGNDANDLEAMRLCGVTVVPSDAHPCVKDIADVVLNTKGGCGVVRELADIID